MNVEKMTLEQIKNTYADFKGLLVKYANANGTTLDLDILHAAIKITMLDEIHRILFMIYILEYWYAYAMDIINGKYAYINYTPMVWDSFREHLAHK